ncbi:unnamed protein product [Linum trigynum]|uniref:Uncharacterized protein n=1 Tax=Linum trigynum TaxID=586398 RepID=A0AAV2E273_9ROSI
MAINGSLLPTMEEEYSPAAAAAKITDSDIQAAEQLMELSNSTANSDGGTTFVLPGDESSSAGSVNIPGNDNKRNNTAEERVATAEEEMVSRRRKKTRKWRSLESIYSATVRIN